MAYITAATKGFYPYDFLDPSEKHGLVAGYVFGIAAGTLIVFGIVWGFIWVRRFVTETKMGKMGKLSAREGHGNGKVADVEMSGPKPASQVNERD